MFASECALGQREHQEHLDGSMQGLWIPSNTRHTLWSLAQEYFQSRSQPSPRVHACEPPSSLQAKERRETGPFKQLDKGQLTRFEVLGKNVCQSALILANKGREMDMAQSWQISWNAKEVAGGKPRIKKARCYSFHMCLQKRDRFHISPFSSLMCIFSSGLVFVTFFYHLLFCYRSFSLAFRWLSNSGSSASHLQNQRVIFGTPLSICIYPACCAEITGIHSLLLQKHKSQTSAHKGWKQMAMAGWF